MRFNLGINRKWMAAIFGGILAASFGLLLRETLISMAVNMAISAGFFLGMFGLRGMASSRLLPSTVFRNPSWSG